MGFWKGMNQAIKAKDERDFTREMFIEEANERRRLALLAFIKPGKSGSSTAGDGTSEGYLKALVEKFGIPVELVARISVDPDAAELIFKEIKSKKIEYDNVGRSFGNYEVGLFFNDLVSIQAETKVGTQEAIDQLAALYGVTDQDEEILEGSGMTWGDALRQASSTTTKGQVVPFFDYSAFPEPINLQDAKVIRDQLFESLEGFLTTAVDDLRRDAESAKDNNLSEIEITAITDEISLVAEYLRQAKAKNYDNIVSTKYFTEAIDRFALQDSRVYTIFRDLYPQGATVRPDLPPVEPQRPPLSFNTAEEAKRAFDLGKIKVGDTIMIAGETILVKE